MKQRDLQDCINDKLEKYFSDLNGEKANGVFKMVTNQAESTTLNLFSTKSIKITVKLQEFLALIAPP